MELRPAGLRWRGLAALLDALGVLALWFIAMQLGVFALHPMELPDGWFWPEWLLSVWTVEPRKLLVPVGAWVLLHWLWVVVWDAWAGRTPGARLSGLALVDRQGREASRIRRVARALALLGVPLSLGLGWLWIGASRYRRALHDIATGCWVIRESPPGP